MKMKFFMPGTAERVPSHSSENVNEKIRRDTLRILDEVGNDRVKIEQRLRELEKEWDIERTLEANAATVSFLGVALGASVNRKWLALPALVAGFLFQHATQGWCPPVPLFRRLGVRTQREIDNERAVLLGRMGVLKGLDKSPSETALKSLEGEYLQ